MTPNATELFGRASREHGAEPDRAERLDRLLFQHLQHVEAFRAWTEQDPPRLEVAVLTAAQPSVRLADVNDVTPVAALGVINPNTVAIAVGWAGYRAANGQGLVIPAASYLMLPVRTQYADVGSPAGLGGGELVVFVFEYDRPQRVAAGSLGGSSSGSSASTVTAGSPRSVAVGVVSVAVLAANPSRKGSSYVNTGATTISLGLGATAIAGDDIVLAPNGSWDGMVGSVLWTGAVNAISSAAGGSLSAVEV